MDRPWPIRAIEATRGNQTLMGCIMLGILGKAPSNPPRFVYPCVAIDANGWLHCHFQDRNGVAHPWHPICTVEEFRDNLRRLADHIKLDDVEREAMFDQAKKWIEIDERAIQEDVI